MRAPELLRLGARLAHKMKNLMLTPVRSEPGCHCRVGGGELGEEKA